MVPVLRKAYNEAFTKESYQAFLNELEALHPGQLDFRVCETPVFVDNDFKHKMLDACESIIDLICSPSFKSMTQSAIPAKENVPNEYPHAHMIAFDFGVCSNASGGTTAD